MRGGLLGVAIAQTSINWRLSQEQMNRLLDQIEQTVERLHSSPIFASEKPLRIDEERTRFLGRIDRMVVEDPVGAVRDMLQVLRERGVLVTCSARETASSFATLQYGDLPDFNAHMASGAVRSSMDLIAKTKGAVILETKGGGMEVKSWTASIEVVRHEQD